MDFHMRASLLIMGLILMDCVGFLNKFKPLLIIFFVLIWLEDDLICNPTWELEIPIPMFCEMLVELCWTVRLTIICLEFVSKYMVKFRTPFESVVSV